METFATSRSVKRIAIPSKAIASVPTSAAASSVFTEKTASGAFRFPAARTVAAGIHSSVTAEKATRESSVKNVSTQFKKKLPGRSVLLHVL